VNVQDGLKFTPLIWAIYNSHKEIVELLITYGSDVNAMDDDGGVPLYHATYWGKNEMVELLIAKGRLFRGGIWLNLAVSIHT
jgi:ankyrin repeat protein